MRPESLGEFEQALLLAIVHLGDNAYGATIHDEVESRTGKDVAIGALYTALGRLERKAYVRSKESDPTPQRGGRFKRHYRLTAAGASALRHCRARLDRMWADLRPDLTRSRP